LSITHGYQIYLPIEGSEDLPPVGSFIYVRWTESNDEPPGWYIGRIDQYFLQGTCKLIYGDKNIVYEIVDLRKVMPCAKRARKFVPLRDTPVVHKANWKQSPKFAQSLEHSIKGYTDDVTLISVDCGIYTSVLQTIDQSN